MKKLFFLFFLLSAVHSGYSQTELIGKPGTKTPRNNQQGQPGNAAKKDSSGFQQRDDLKDSITISYRYLDAIRRYQLDSSVNDIDRYFPVPVAFQFMGNNGSAAFPIVFTPNNKAGWDVGLHAFDTYLLTLEGTKFYKTTRPFTLLGYQLSSGKEQVVQAQHTQNIKPNFNAGFDYRLINAPGFFINQNNNHNNIRLFANYQGPHKRYNSFFVLYNNTIRASENAGIVNDSNLLDPNYKDRFGIDVKMGNNNSYNSNPFSTTIRTGNIYKEFQVFLRQSYDIGQKDSIAINDSTTEYLFYPRLRIQHSFTYNSSKYRFTDEAADSVLYKNWYNVSLPLRFDSFDLEENWNRMENDLSLIQFPDAKNPAQFLLAGATLQNIKGEINGGEETLYNIKLHGEYRNRTRNRKWDMLLKGEFYLNGYNTGDYNVTASLSRLLNKKLGDVRLFFSNTNRTPSFIFDPRSAFNLGNTGAGFNKENITSFGATSSNPFVQLGFTNHLLTNYSYFKNYYEGDQSSKLINVLQLYASKRIRLTRSWNWYLDAVIQQTDGAAPVKVPLLYTRSRFAFEGKLFKNLDLSTGFEVRYFTPYRANHYSPVIGQFVPQDSITQKNLPDIHAFLHFRIKSFTGFVRAENLNTFSAKHGFAFVNNNFAAPGIPTPALMIRFGIRWWFVN